MTKIKYKLIVLSIIMLLCFGCRKDIKPIQDFYEYIDIHDYARDNFGLTKENICPGGYYVFYTDTFGGKRINEPIIIGPTPKEYEKIYVYYAGYLLTGQEISSKKKPEDFLTAEDSEKMPFSFIFKSNYSVVIAGWDSAFTHIRRGNYATFLLPPELGYGNVSRTKIPPNSPLRFDVELLWLVGDTTNQKSKTKHCPDYEISKIVGLIE